MADEDPIRRWAERIGALNTRLEPFCDRKVDIADPAWVTKLTASQPLEEAGVKVEAERLLVEIVEYYAGTSDERRAQIRKLFDRNRAFAWAAALPDRPVSAVTVRQNLLLFSIIDLGRDSRDATLWLMDICKSANLAGVPLNELLDEVAALSNNHNKHGMGSARDLLLRAL